MESLLRSYFSEQVDEIQTIKSSKIKYDDELIKSCQMNHCGKYNKNWMCPPAINQKQIIKELDQFENIIVISKVTLLEDCFDIEGMDKGRKYIEQLLIKMNNILKSKFNYKVLGPGTCSICKECSYPIKECNFPTLATPSLEALGVNVIELAKSSNMKYYNGPNTVTYFAAIFY